VIVVPENSFEFRINKFRRSLNEVNSSFWNVKLRGSRKIRTPEE